MSVIKFPYSASRRVHSKKPRRSKNGTPEERAARAAADAAKMPLASVVDLSRIEARSREDVDRRKLRGSPLRDKVPLISFAVTIVGKMCTADLKGEDLPSDTAGWREELRTGAAAAR